MLKSTERLFDEEEKAKAAKIADYGYEYEEDEIDADFVEREEKDDFDYDGYRMHKYDDYEGELTVEIALVKYERLVRSLARKYEGRGAEYAELFQLGQIKLQQLIEENPKRRYMSNYLRRTLRRYVSKAAQNIREAERWEERESPVAMEALCCEAVGYDWHKREVAMFKKVSHWISKEEMKLLMAFYQGRTRQQIAKIFGISRPIVNKRLERLRVKITPLIPWLEDRMEFPCTNYCE